MAHPLSDLDKRSIGRFTTLLGHVGPGRAHGEHRFSLMLKDSTGNPYEPPVISGLYFQGMGRWYRPWLEVRYQNRLVKGTEIVDLSTTPEEESLFKMLCDILPPGSHIMVPYRTHRITAMALIFGVPPPASPLGYLMYLGGCRWYKDWYFAEAFMEGEEKLQATKPLDEVRKKAKTARIKEQLRRYLESNPDVSKPEMESVCRDLARRIIDLPEGS